MPRHDGLHGVPLVLVEEHVDDLQHEPLALHHQDGPLRRLEEARRGPLRWGGVGLV